jgi:hypothetical protein
MGNISNKTKCLKYVLKQRFKKALLYEVLAPVDFKKKLSQTIVNHMMLKIILTHIDFLSEQIEMLDQESKLLSRRHRTTRFHSWYRHKNG